jgi:hypothetical protein
VDLEAGGSRGRAELVVVPLETGQVIDGQRSGRPRLPKTTRRRTEEST